MPIATDDVFRFTIRQRLASQLVVNNWFLRALQPVIPGSEQQTAQATVDQIKEVLRPLQIAAVTYESWSGQKVRGTGVVRDSATCKISGGELFEGSFTAPLAGSIAEDPLPPQDAIVVTLRTALAGRSRRGRHYLAGLGETSQSAGVISSGHVTNLQAAYNAYGGANKPGGAFGPVWEWGVWSETIASGCKPSAVHPHDRVFFPALGQHPELAFQVITLVVVRNLVRSQRRRQLGVGV